MLEEEDGKGYELVLRYNGVKREACQRTARSGFETEALLVDGN